ncbi:MAG: carboxypeptidase regulatory-like domain-containing protein [Thermoplasmatales archaeon]|nr:MAG: carboxypeptidase regulatory-like domain-containing protein [Thermoplasmatales archaeon]
MSYQEDKIIKKSLLNEGIIFTVVVLLFGAGLISSIVGNAGDTIPNTISYESNTPTSGITIYNGSLSGYVNDTSMNPIEGARIRVYFHETFEENYSDSSGRYHVANIPICYCMKNCTASKEGYATEGVLLDITENTTRDFVLTPLDPCYPVFNGTMGDNGWFVNCVTITFIFDPEEISAVYYKVDGGSWQIYSGPLIVCDDGVYELCWRYVDNEGHQSDIYCEYFMIDQTKPEIELTVDTYKEDGLWYLVLTAIAEDECSGMNRVEFYINDILQEKIIGPGPNYEWIIPWILENYSVTGLICNRRITEENVSFFAFIVKTSAQYPINWDDTVKAKAYDNAGNWALCVMDSPSPPPDFPIIFRHFTFCNNYEGYIGRFFIDAVFEKGPLVTTLSCKI